MLALFFYGGHASLDELERGFRRKTAVMGVAIYGSRSSYALSSGAARA